MTQAKFMRTYLTSSALVWLVCLLMAVTLIVTPIYIMFKYSLAHQPYEG